MRKAVLLEISCWTANIVYPLIFASFMTSIWVQVPTKVTSILSHDHEQQVHSNLQRYFLEALKIWDFVAEGLGNLNSNESWQGLHWKGRNVNSMRLTTLTNILKTVFYKTFSNKRPQALKAIILSICQYIGQTSCQCGKLTWTKHLITNMTKDQSITLKNMLKTVG